MTASINAQGYLITPRVRRTPRPHVEHGLLTSIKGIIVHQTDADNADATLNGYLNDGANGAHFLTAALRWLIAELTALLRIQDDEIFRHPEVSRKNLTEAATAEWK